MLFPVGALDLFFGEFVTGLLLGGILGPILIIFAVTAEDWWPFSKDHDIDREDESDRGAGAGILVADYVNADVLQSIARQKSITPEPTESEKARSNTTEGAVGLQKLPLFGRLIRRRTENEKLKWEHREDLNVMLSRVLEKLEGSGELHRHLGHIPYVSLGDESVMDQLAEAAKEHAEAQAARESLSTVRARLMAEEKRAEYDRFARTSGDFVLVEGTWTVTRLENGNVRLRLAHLLPDLHRAPSESVSMPDGVALVAEFPETSLSDQGRSRISGQDHRAEVFGTPGSMNDGTLNISAVAVFGRFGAAAARPPTYAGGIVAEEGYVRC